MGVAGLCLLLLASQHSRGVVISQFDIAVARWASHVRPAFINASFVLHANRTRREDRVSLALLSNATNEPFADHGTDVPTYLPLRYEKRSWPRSGATDFAALDDLNVHLALTTVAPHTGARCTFDLSDPFGVPLAYRSTWPYTRQVCNGRFGGSYIPSRGECVSFYALAEVCIKVSVRDGCLSPDSSGGGVGCYAGTEGAWAPVSYTHVRGVRPQGGPAFHREPPEQLPRPMLRVRHVADPLVVAHNLTSGRLSFGVDDRVKVLGGAELLLCAAALSVPAIVFFLRRMRVPCIDGSRGRGGLVRVGESDESLVRLTAAGVEPRRTPHVERDERQAYYL